MNIIYLLVIPEQSQFYQASERRNRRVDGILTGLRGRILGETTAALETHRQLECSQ